jgi:DNA-binding transcriptional ArsR family regulator
MTTISKAELLLHPIRMRIVTEVVGRQLTTRQIAAALPDIPQATLYRQVGTLLEGGILEVVAEQRINGAVERSYAVKAESGQLSPDDLRGLTPEQHLEYFSVFANALIADFAAYIRQADTSRVLEDGLSYSRATVYLTEAQAIEIKERVRELVLSYISQPPAEGAERFVLGSVFIPQGESES